MAFGFSNSSAGAGGAASSGPDLETITTERLGFLSIAGDAKVRLTTGWDPLPAPASKLLSISSRKGLVAAAGPDQIIIASTESTRKAFEAPKNDDGDVRDFNPQLKLPLPMRISQLSFTANDEYLVMSAESGGGLAVYEVQGLLSGSTNTAFELPTNGESLRALVPNPTREKGELCAIVTANGNLHMADLKARRVSDPLKTQVSCVSWSSKGKQLCAGLGDGTIHQMTPEGNGKAEIPRPPGLDNHYVSSLTWLENDMWLAIYTSSGDEPTSTYNIVTRQQPGNFTFQKISDPIAPFVAEKPPHHSILRLREWGPDLKDLLIVSSDVIPDIGLLTRSTKPLTVGSDGPVDAFATTEVEDSKRPTLPMTDSMDDSTAIGLAIDLSSKDKVYKPIPSDEELEESPDPVPGLWILTHEGILCSWWLIYEDSIRQSKPYQGLAVQEASAPSQPAVPPAATTSTPFAPAKSAFGSTATTTPSFGSPNAAPSFGSSTQIGLKSSPWGAPSTTSPSHTSSAVFGSSSFGNSAAPAAPAFGKPSTPGFGQATQLGAKTSPWSTTGASTTGSAGTSGPAFGQSGFAGFANKSSSASPWGTPAANTTQQTGSGSSGGFAGFSNSGQGGFASVASKNEGSIFGGGGQTSQNPFGSAKQEDTAFPPPKAGENKSSSGVFGSEPFKLRNTFQDSATNGDDGAKGAGSSGSSLFGNNFTSALDSTKSTAPTASEQPSQEVDMDAESSAEPASETQPKSKSLFDTQPRSLESTTPQSTPTSKFMTSAPSPATQTPGSSLFGKPTPAVSSSGGLFGSGSGSGTGSLFNKAKEADDGAAEHDTPKAKPVFGSGPSLFGKPKESSDVASDAETPKPKGLFGSGSGGLFNKPKESSNLATGSETPKPAPIFGAPSGGLFGKPKDTGSSATEPEVPKVKQETPDAPLPPDTTSRLAYPLGDSSSSSATSNATTSSKSTFGQSSSQHAPGSAADPLATPKPTRDAPQPASETPEESHTPESTPGGSGQSNPDFVTVPRSVPEPTDDGKSDEDGTEGSGIDVAQDLSPDSNDKGHTLGSNTQSIFSFPGSKPAATQAPTNTEPARPIFGGLGNKPALFPTPRDTSPRSPSPIRGAVPSRLSRNETRSVSAPGMASQLLKSKNTAQRPSPADSAHGAQDPFIMQMRRQKARQEAEETQLLVDTEDDQMQNLLSSEVEPTLSLDEFIAHTNSAPPAQDSVPSQVEAVYRDINSMIDTIGLNARSVKAFVKGHSELETADSKTKNDMDDADGWILCEVDTLGHILDTELREDLETGQVQNFDDKLKACKDLARDVQRLRAKSEDIAKLLMAKTDPTYLQGSHSLPLSAEQSAQQNELRKEFRHFSANLAQAEEALTMLKTKIATTSGSGRRKTAVPTVEAVMRTITKMTSMVEQRSGDIDVLENQMRKMGLGSGSREGSPIVTPQARRSIMFSPESTPSRNFRHSLAASIGSLGTPSKGTPSRRKVTTFSEEEKQELKNRRERRQAVLAKLKESVESKGPVQVWSLEEME